VGGYEEVLGPFFAKETMTHEFIPVEKIIRDYLKEVSNAYCLVLFACCRTIKNMSDLEVEKLK
jgi:hypothetical protein